MKIEITAGQRHTVFEYSQAAALNRTRIQCRGVFHDDGDCPSIGQSRDILRMGYIAIQTYDREQKVNNRILQKKFLFNLCIKLKILK